MIQRIRIVHQIRFLQPPKDIAIGRNVVLGLPRSDRSNLLRRDPEMKQVPRERLGTFSLEGKDLGVARFLPELCQDPIKNQLSGRSLSTLEQNSERLSFVITPTVCLSVRIYFSPSSTSFVPRFSSSPVSCIFRGGER